MESKRKLKLLDIFCIASGAMISSGLFVLPVLAYKYSGPAVILAYFLAGLLFIPSILSKAELLTAMPKTGGVYFFIARSFGPFLGIFGGLAAWFSLGLKSAFALIGIGTFLEYFVPEVSYFQIKLVAAYFCVVFMIINFYSVKLSARIQNGMVFFLFLACIAYIIFGLNRSDSQNFIPFLPHGMKPFLPVVGLVFISYGGITKVASIAEETENPSKTIPLGMGLSFIAVQTLYVLCVAATIGILSPGQLTSTLTPLTHGALKIGGLAFCIVMSLAALTAFFSTANAGILSSSRVPYAMAKDDLLPNRFSLVSKKTRTPYFSIIITGLFMLSLILFLDLENLVKTASSLQIILFMLANLSVIIMRESKMINYRPTFRTPLYPWIQIFAIIAYGFLIFEMGRIPLIISFSFVGISLAWFLFSARKLKRQSALLHLVERITAKELVDTTLEEELRTILHKRDNIIKDRFDHLIEECPVLNIKERMTRDEFFEYISKILSGPLGFSPEKIKQLLIKREEESHTVIEKGLAIPHIIVPGQNKFEIVVVRATEGIVFSPDEEPVHVMFVLAGSQDERNFHLRALMSIAHIVREHNFYSYFMRAKNEEVLRLLILSSARERILKPFAIPKKPKKKT
ncbi:MAG: amino acid permease [Candidatus Omnitrophota bacterium]|nr:MAG: amino acid permease [Candidatus Omnitrophota bacterium]